MKKLHVFNLIGVLALAVLIALVLDPALMLLTATTVYAISGPALWLRRRRAASPLQSG